MLKEAFYDPVFCSRQVQKVPRRNIRISQEQRIRVSRIVRWHCHRPDSSSHHLVLCANTPVQLDSRTINAPLLRYVDSMRAHGHRAARINPLDPARYENKHYNVDVIVRAKPIEESRDGAGEGEWWTSKE